MSEPSEGQLLERTDYTLTIGEEITEEKARAFVAQFGDKIRDYVDLLVERITITNPDAASRTLFVDADQLMRWNNGRAPYVRGGCDFSVNVARIDVADTQGQSHTFFVSLDWDTGRCLAALDAVVL